MAGFNYTNLVLIDCNIDIYHEHLIRSTMGAFFKTNIVEFNSLNTYLNKYDNQTFVNISKEGNNLLDINNTKNISLIFSKDAIKKENVTNISFKEDISLDNIVNIVLFTLYK